MMHVIKSSVMLIAITNVYTTVSVSVSVLAERGDLVSVLVSVST